ncbi:MAG: hypothetical protein AAGK00_16425 [Pseudomonadota bacterium]
MEFAMIVAVCALAAVLVWAVMRYEPPRQARPVRIKVEDRRRPRR